MALLGNTHAPLVSLAARLLANHLGRQTLGAFIDPFHAFSSVANLVEASAQMAAISCRLVSKGLWLRSTLQAIRESLLAQGGGELVSVKPWRGILQP